MAQHRGFAAVGTAALETTGWEIRKGGSTWDAALPDGTRLTLQEGLPFAAIDGVWAQMVQAPYTVGDSAFVPVQLLTDVLPDRLPGQYRASGSRTLSVQDAALWRGGGSVVTPRSPTNGPVRSGAFHSPSDPGASALPARKDDGVRVVVIDAGHGGRDPGALGPRRTREKDVTLAVALALAEELRGDPLLEVHLTRDDDVFIPLWERGELATRLKGERPGIFISIHANSVARRDVRGVETYFLSEARTEHEARVAALENSAMELERNRSGPDASELGFIISELLNLDYQHWSSDLAGGIQRALVQVHPGPDRGVKQGPLAVLTNAMMPSVLMEVGFITHPAEEEVLARPEFHRRVAAAAAGAVRDFFRRYPPGAAPLPDP